MRDDVDNVGGRVVVVDDDAVLLLWAEKGCSGNVVDCFGTVNSIGGFEMDWL